MNKAYKTFAELYAARPNDLPFVIRVDNEQDVVVVPIGLEHAAVINLTSNYDFGIWDIPTIAALNPIDMVISDYFDDSAPVQWKCTCDIVSLMQQGCLCGEMRRERLAG